MKKAIYIDSSVILDFAEPKKDKIFGLLETFIDHCKADSVFCITEYIWEVEIKDIKVKYKKSLEKKIEIEDTPEEVIFSSPPASIDLGEWTLYLAAKRRGLASSCVLTSDSAARDFFQKKKLLPCDHLNPPVGGTLGILNFLAVYNLLDLTIEEVIAIMKKHNRRLP